jgi:uncharacterized protein YjbI with pentapeptide repeats
MSFLPSSLSHISRSFSVLLGHTLGWTESRVKARLNINSLEGADLASAPFARTPHFALSGAKAIRANFFGLNLTRSHFHEAALWGANLSNTKAPRVDFSEAFLCCADMSRMRAKHGNFQNAFLRAATLDEGDFRGADFDGAVMDNCSLRNTDLRGADLRGALGLSARQIRAAVTDSTTLLPPGITISRPVPAQDSPRHTPKDLRAHPA